MSTKGYINAYKLRSYKMYHSHGNTHSGLIRANNQDAIFMDDTAGIWIVADGMGGHNAGEVASNWVCEYLPNEVKNQPITVTQAIQNVHQELQELGSQRPEFKGMGTTMIMAIVHKQHVELYWSGDCRGYLVGHDTCTLVSKDHSVVQNLIELQVIDEKAAARHPQRHIVTSCLGGNHSKPKIDTIRLSLNENDTLLLCSDGLYRELSDRDLLGIISNTNHPTPVAERLVKQANQLGGRDNISAVLITKNGLGEVN
ncbi:MAG: protein phosphatase 2C domain-containing protein [Paraglaciecola sp.]|uniref:PP2C family protein-serine/threonine phosphatase n=1 Tax=Paraglaciecola sp. TaxID=1920173 RepID=UPI0032975EBD